MEEYLGVALRLSVMYLYALAVLRLTGKRALGDLSAADFITTLIVGDQFDDVFWGTVPLANGLLAVGVIIFLHGLVSWLTYHSNLLDWLLASSSPALLVKNGRFVREGMAQQRLNEDDLRSLMRELGEENLSETREANLEPSGVLSVLKKEEYKPAQKRDLEGLRVRR